MEKATSEKDNKILIIVSEGWPQAVHLFTLYTSLAGGSFSFRKNDLVVGGARRFFLTPAGDHHLLSACRRQFTFLPFEQALQLAFFLNRPQAVNFFTLYTSFAAGFFPSEKIIWW